MRGVLSIRPFYRYGGHIKFLFDLSSIKEYYRMPRGGMSTFRLYFRAHGTFFLKVFLE